MQLSMRKLFEVYLLVTLPKLLSYKEVECVSEVCALTRSPRDVAGGFL